MKTDYQKQGEDFLKETGTKMTVKFIANKKHFEDEKESRDVFRVTFTRGKIKRSIVFGQSIAQSTGHGDNSPSAYDVLACLTKQDFADFKDFCESFGYEEDSRKAYRTFKAVHREFKKVNDLWPDCIEQLCEIN
jgi:hypothetical protein